MRTLPQQGRGRRRGGFVLIVTLIVSFAIASLVLTLGRLGRTEALASANQLAQYEASAVERGAEQYVLAIASDPTQLDTLDETDFEAVPVGTGYFWVVRPDYLDDELPLFGLVDEAAKLPLNQVTAEELSQFSDMPAETASAIVEWRGGAADSGRYSGSGYVAKEAPFETPEELMMVEGVTREIYFGEAATARAAGGASSSSTLIGNDGPQTAGWQHYFTPFGTPQTEPPPPNPASPPSLINVNEAPRDVLVALFPVPSTVVDAGLQQRATAVNADPASIEWTTNAFPGLGVDIRNRLTARGSKFSADIVAAAGNGRAFKRVRIVVDGTQSPPRIVYRRDITAEGFPLDASILTSLRDGSFAGGGSSSRLGGSSR